MTEEKKPRFSVITNTEIDIPKRSAAKPEYGGGYQTNPIYEKLLKFNMEQKRKRFTVEDLLRW